MSLEEVPRRVAVHTDDRQRSDLARNAGCMEHTHHHSNASPAGRDADRVLAEGVLGPEEVSGVAAEAQVAMVPERTYCR
jgi:hypothetical protein